MKLIHYQASGPKEIPLGPATLSTLHTKRTRADEVQHLGIGIRAPYAGEAERQKKHFYELVIEPAELPSIVRRLVALGERFLDPDELPSFRTLDQLDALYAVNQSEEDE